MYYDRLALVGFVIRKRDIEYRRLVGVADIMSARFINLGNLSIVDVPSYDFAQRCLINLILAKSLRIA